MPRKGEKMSEATKARLTQVLNSPEVNAKLRKPKRYRTAEHNAAIGEGGRRAHAARKARNAEGD